MGTSDVGALWSALTRSLIREDVQGLVQLHTMRAQARDGVLPLILLPFLSLVLELRPLRNLLLHYAEDIDQDLAYLRRETELRDSAGE
jgi:hypothetical protein